MQINGHTGTLGLMGNPVEHTMSPVIHNNLSEATGNNLVYVPFHVPTGEVGNAVKGAFALNLQGLNVTVPYKQEVIPFLVDIDPLAKRIGAVNTLVRCENGFKGYNTDMPGLLRAMQGDGVNVKNEDVIILGAGGVARAVAMLLADEGAASITIVNRSVDRAVTIANEVNSYLGEDKVHVISLNDIDALEGEHRYLCVQATSVGMHPNVDDAVITDDKFYSLIKVGYDLIFNPLETKFMKLCEKAGAKAFNGYRMLLYQGVIAYEYWTGNKISNDLALQVYEKMLEAMRG